MIEVKNLARQGQHDVDEEMDHSNVSLMKNIYEQSIHSILNKKNFVRCECSITMYHKKENVDELNKTAMSGG